jgi:transposase
MRSVQESIDEPDGEISAIIQYRRNDLAIAMSMTGTGFVPATAILVEIGKYTDFEKPESCKPLAQIAREYGNHPNLPC